MVLDMGMKITLQERTEHQGEMSLCSEWAWGTELPSENHLAKVSQEKGINSYLI